MRKLICTLLLSFGVLAPISSNAADSPDVVGILFYADWCGSCKTLDPKIETVKQEFADDSILFTRVDLTDDFTKQQSAYLAAMLGLEEVYAQNNAKTGFMLLVNRESGQVLSKLTKTQSETEISRAIRQALGS